MNTSPVIIGLMSGTSLDGTDLVACRFMDEGGKYRYEVLEGVTVPYPAGLQKQLQEARQADGWGLTVLDRKLGKYSGNIIVEFCRGKAWKPGLISSHGHTVFHRPDRGITLQIGSGAEIAAVTGLPTVCDFRTLDVALGGNGAPLVPLGDALLFGEWDACINLGGFANISAQQNGERIAWDICPFNTVLNAWARQKGMEYDPGGSMAANGKVIPELYAKWNGLEYYTRSHPKSLGIEWVDENILAEKNLLSHSPEDLLRTWTEHAAKQINEALQTGNANTVLFTGGGTFNQFFVEHFREKYDYEITIPEEKIIHYKEALIFALLGYLRYQHKINVWKSVTGGSRDHMAGAIYEGKNVE